MRKPIEDLPGEEWRDAPGYEGIYHISNKGRIKSFVRGGGPALMKPAIVGPRRGYWAVRLTKDGKAKGQYIHRLVLMAFDPRENCAELEVNHKNFDTHDASLENLEWCTPKENTHHFNSSGRPRAKNTCMGVSHHFSKLTDADVLQIRELYAANKHHRHIQRDIAKQYGLNKGTVRSILIGQTWKHLLPAR